jgi:hypothetical protein
MGYTLLCLILEHGLQLLDPVPCLNKRKPQFPQLRHAGPQHLLFASFGAVNLPVSSLFECLAAALTSDCHAWSLEHLSSKMGYTLFPV